MKLQELMQRKQMHRCNNNCKSDWHNSRKYKYKFPFDNHLELNTSLDPKRHWRMYYYPNQQHCNIVPCHTSVLLLRQWQKKIQRINDTSLSYYLLKYAMRIELIKKLNLNIVGSSWAFNHLAHSTWRWYLHMCYQNPRHQPRWHCMLVGTHHPR